MGVPSERVNLRKSSVNCKVSGPGFPEPTEYVRRMLSVTLADGAASRAWTYVYNWPVAGLPRIASGRFLET